MAAHVARAERADTVALYRKSLLYLVSNAFEDERGAPLAGMTRFWGGDDPFAPKNVRLLIAGEPEETPGGGATRKVFTSLSKTHGGFDNDPVTMNHLLAKFLGRPSMTEADGGFGLGQLASPDF